MSAQEDMFGTLLDISASDSCQCKHCHLKCNLNEYRLRFGLFWSLSRAGTGLKSTFILFRTKLLEKDHLTIDKFFWILRRLHK